MDSWLRYRRDHLDRFLVKAFRHYNDNIVVVAKLDHSVEGQGDHLMLVQPRAPKQKIKRRLQVDDIEFDIEFDRTNGKRNNQDPQRIIPFTVGMISSTLNPSFNAVRRGQTLRPDPLSTSKRGMRNLLNCTVINRG